MRQHLPTPLGAVLFDMDGLLVDSEPLWHRAEIAVFARYGLHLTPELCRLTKGKFVVEVTTFWYQRHPWSGASPEEVATEIVDEVAALVRTTSTLLPGVHHALEFCRDRVPLLGLASSSPMRLIDEVLDRFGLRSYFDVVHSAEAEAAGKPDPAVFLTAAALLGVPPGRCVVLEDSPAGVGAALAAGMQCIAVPERRAGVPELVGPPEVPVLASLRELGPEVWALVESRVASASANADHD